MALILPAAAWGHAAGYFTSHSEFGEPIERVYNVASQEFGDESWWPEIVAFHQNGVALQVTTALSAEDHATCNEVYERIWLQPGFLPTWNSGKLFIFDRDDNPMCGGAA